MKVVRTLRDEGGQRRRKRTMRRTSMRTKTRKITMKERRKEKMVVVVVNEEGKGDVWGCRNESQRHDLLLA